MSNDHYIFVTSDVRSLCERSPTEVKDCVADEFHSFVRDGSCGPCRGMGLEPGFDVDSVRNHEEVVLTNACASRSGRRMGR